MNKDQSKNCCPEFNPKLWDDQTFEWKEKRFIKDKICTIFYMPLNFGKVMTRMDERATKANATIPDGLCLCDHTSSWNIDTYLAVDKEVPGTENITLNGTFYCKTYEGDFKDTGKWCEDFGRTAKSKGLKIGKMYMWYTTCPKCAKKYGKNYVAIFAPIEE